MVAETIGANTTDTYSGSLAARMVRLSPTTNFNGLYLEVSKWNAGSDETDSILEFDLTSIPDGATINSATLHLYRTEGNASIPVDIRQLLRTPVFTEATWNIYSTGNNWTTGGARSDGNDRSATISGTITIDNSNGYKVSSDIGTLIAAALPSNVIRLQLERNGTGEEEYFRADGVTGTDGQRPFLTVDYTTAGETISSIGGGNTLVNGSTATAMVVSGFTEAITSLTIQSGTAQTSATNISGSDPNYTFDIFDISAIASDTVGAPLTTASNVVQAVAAGATETSAAFTINHNPKTGYAAQEVTSASGADGSVYKGFSVLPADGSVLNYPTANNTSVDAAGILTTDQSTGSIDMQLWDSTDDTWKPFSVILSAISGGNLLGGFIVSPVANAVRQVIRNPVR